MYFTGLKESAIGVVRHEFYCTELKTVRCKNTEPLRFDNKRFFLECTFFVRLFMARKSVSVNKSQTDKYKLKTVRQNMEKYTYVQYTSVIIFFLTIKTNHPAKNETR